MRASNRLPERHAPVAKPLHRAPPAGHAYVAARWRAGLTPPSRKERSIRAPAPFSVVGASLRMWRGRAQSLQKGKRVEPGAVAVFPGRLQRISADQHKTSQPKARFGISNVRPFN